MAQSEGRLRAILFSETTPLLLGAVGVVLFVYCMWLSNPIGWLVGTLWAPIFGAPKGLQLGTRPGLFGLDLEILVWIAGGFVSAAAGIHWCQGVLQKTARRQRRPRGDTEGQFAAFLKSRALKMSQGTSRLRTVRAASEAEQEDLLAAARRKFGKNILKKPWARRILKASGFRLD